MVFVDNKVGEKPRLNLHKSFIYLIVYIPNLPSFKVSLKTIMASFESLMNYSFLQNREGQ